MSNNYKKLFKTLSESLDSFIREVYKQNLTYMATEEWNVKDMLCHITFWHMYYAKNYSSLANGTKPYVFKGSSTRNKDGVNQLRLTSFPNLISKLYLAHKSLYKSIVIKKVPEMSYTIGRIYQTDVFLEMIAKHIQRHTIQVRSAKKKSKTNYPD